MWSYFRIIKKIFSFEIQFTTVKTRIGNQTFYEPDFLAQSIINVTLCPLLLLIK